jgi:hypothetical protein
MPLAMASMSSTMTSSISAHIEPDANRPSSIFSDIEHAVAEGIDVIHDDIFDISPYRMLLSGAIVDMLPYRSRSRPVIDVTRDLIVGTSASRGYVTVDCEGTGALAERLPLDDDHQGPVRRTPSLRNLHFTMAVEGLEVNMKIAKVVAPVILLLLAPVTFAQSAKEESHVVEAALTELFDSNLPYVERWFNPVF